MQWGHVGDSRLYYFKNGKIVKRTLDHSVPQMLVARGEIDEKEIRHHPDRNRLVRVMGMEWDEPKYQVSEPMPEEPDRHFCYVRMDFGKISRKNRWKPVFKNPPIPMSG